MPSPLRRAARTVLVAALASSLLLPLGATAGAATRPSRHAGHRLTISKARRQLRALAARSSGIAPAALARGSHVVYSDAVFPVHSHDPNFPDWIVGVERLGNEAYVFVATDSELANGFAESYWFQELPASDVAFDSRLRRVEIHTGTELGSFGSVDFTFTPTHRGRHVIRCRRTHRVLGAERRAGGTMAGTFTFNPSMPGFPAALHATAPHAVVDQIAFNGRRCREGGGVILTQGCFRERQFRVVDGAGGLLAADPRNGVLEATAETTVGEMHIFRDVAVFPDFGFTGHVKNPVSVTDTTLTIDGDKAGDPFSGTISFDRVGASVVHRTRHCQRVTSTFEWSGGSLLVDLPGSPVTFTGDDLEARFLRRGPRR